MDRAPQNRLGQFRSGGDPLRRYFNIIFALLRREEQRRRAAPGEAVLDLLEPIAMLTVMSVAAWFVGRRQTAMLGGPPILFYATGFFALYFFIYLSKVARRASPPPKRRFPVERRLDHILVHTFLKAFDYAVLGFLLFGFLYLFFTAQALPYNCHNNARVWLGRL